LIGGGSVAGSRQVVTSRKLGTVGKKTWMPLFRT
jgi:hypothetical protein